MGFAAFLLRYCRFWPCIDGITIVEIAIGNLVLNVRQGNVQFGQRTRQYNTFSAVAGNIRGVDQEKLFPVSRREKCLETRLGNDEFIAKKAAVLAGIFF